MPSLRVRPGRRLFRRPVLATQDGLPERYNVFTAALNQIDAKYVEKVESDRLVYGAINGMLQTLDPHSSFMDPKAYAALRERQEGHYYGLGISINVVDGDITVLSLFEGSPAYKKGIRRGDVIAKINGEDAKGWTSEQAVVEAARPARHAGAGVHQARRLRQADRRRSRARRDQHSQRAGVASCCPRDTGYIQLHDFSETTDRELGAALKDLTGKGMKRLLLDIRENPGGPLDQAIKVSNRFLEAGRPDRLHARAHSEFRSGLPRGGQQRLHQPAARRAGEPPQRERVGNRDGRAAGSRSRAGRRRNDVGQSARAVDLSPSAKARAWR